MAAKRQAQAARLTASLVARLAAVLFCAALVATHAQAQQQDAKNKDRLWADEILYEGTPRHFRAKGEVRLRVQRDGGQIFMLTESLDYDGKQGIVRAEGGIFGKGRNRKTQGVLRLVSGETIFFQSLETDEDLTPLKGENLGWRDTQGHGGLSAASFLRRTRKKHKKDDWIFHNIRYTRCPICADALAKQDKKQDKEQDKDNKKKTKTSKPRTFPPLWRIDASRMRWERFDATTQGWFNAVPRIHLRNPRLNLYGVPVFYAPYLSFPRDGVRASGLLSPRYGEQSQRGWYVALPLYWAPHRSWDITYTPVFTTGNKDASRLETRAAWSAGGKGDRGKEDEDESEQSAKQAKTKQTVHLFDATAGWSLPHSPIGSGSEAQFFAYGKLRWRAPWGLRADAIYHGLGDRRYLHNYGQGVSLFSTSAPENLTDRARIEHFSKNGYARLTLAEQHELLEEPRADASLLPELSYNNGGVFARSRKGGGSWKVEGLWRRAAQEKQQAIGTTIEAQEAFRQDTLSAAVSLGWRQNLPLSFVSQSALKLATTYRHDTEEGEIVILLPEFQQSLEGLFAQSFKKGKVTLYLRPTAELYATLDEKQTAQQDTIQDKLGGKSVFFETGARLGDRLAFDSTLEGGQRLLVATELGVRGSQQSTLSLFAAPTLLRQKDEPLSGRLWTGARASWRDRLSFAYDTAWLLPQMQQISQRAEAGTKGENFALSLAYKEFHALESSSSSLYSQDIKDIIVKGNLRLRQRWQANLSAGYGFVENNVPIGFSLTYKGSCVTLKFSYDRIIYSDREDSESYNASLRFEFS